MYVAANSMKGAPLTTPTAPHGRRRVAALLTAALATVVVLAVCAPARAGTYQVIGCHGLGEATHDMSAYGYPHYNAWDDCAANRLLNSVAEVNSTYGYREEGGWMTVAPAGTSFIRVSVIAREQRFNGGGGTGLVSVGYLCQTLTSCSVNAPGTTYLLENDTGGPMVSVSNATGNGQWGSSRRYGSTFNSTVLRLGFYCGLFTAPGSPCVNRTSDKLWLQLTSLELLVNDPNPPNIPTVEGQLVSDGWNRGTVGLSGTASDFGGGVSLTRYSLNGAAVSADYAHPCARRPGGYNRTQPCPTQTPWSVAVDTTRVADGQHELKVWNVDASGAESVRQTRTVKVDNTAPAAPTGMAVDGGDGWRSSRAFTVRWKNPPGQFAPIAKSHWQLCRTGGSCTTGTAASASLESAAVQVPDQAGDYTLRVRLEDAAGNTAGANLSDVVHLRYDPTPPGKAQGKVGNGWVNAVEATDYPVPLDLAPNEVEPISGIKGYSITTDGSDPDTTIEAAGRKPTHHIPQLPDGDVTIKSRAVSGAGVPATKIGQVQVKVDGSPPDIAVDGAPSPARWVREPVTIKLTGTDARSGMAAAPTGAALEDGAYLAYRVDDGALRRVPGDKASVSVADDGQHTLEYFAVDFAGNSSPRHTKQFKIDRTPPETIAFEFQDPADPLQLSVLAEDKGSGVEGGQINTRPSSGGEWKPLATTLVGGHLLARVDDAQPDGTYEYAVTVRDRAGNQASSDRRMNGSKMELKLPLRLSSRTRIANGASSIKTCRGTKKRRGSRRRCTIKRRLSTAVKIKAGYRAKVRVTGVVESEGGRPVAGAYLTVRATNRVADSKTRILGHTRADSKGRFEYLISRGPSRIVRFDYEGDNVVKPSAADAHTLVPAAVSFKVNRDRVRNLDTVVFSGRLLSRPIPKAGKLVAIQARIGRAWRTFANPRANARGRFASPYRFTSTSGLQRYRIRALVQKDAAYSYETGASKPITVVVAGR